MCVFPTSSGGTLIFSVYLLTTSSGFFPLHGHKWQRKFREEHHRLKHHSWIPSSSTPELVCPPYQPRLGITTYFIISAAAACWSEIASGEDKQEAPLGRAATTEISEAVASSCGFHKILLSFPLLHPPTQEFGETVQLTTRHHTHQVPALAAVSLRFPVGCWISKWFNLECNQCMLFFIFFISTFSDHVASKKQIIIDQWCLFPAEACSWFESTSCCWWLSKQRLYKELRCYAMLRYYISILYNLWSSFIKADVNLWSEQIASFN